MFENLLNVPDELKVWPQWLVWRYEERSGDGKPTKVPYSGRNGRPASVTEPNTWATFNEVGQALQTGWYAGAGFVLTKGDPFAFVDLDDAEGDEDAYQKQLRIFAETTGYAEISPSGRGLHLIMKGTLPTGRRRGKIEMYSDSRYMTMTGNVYRPGPIETQQPFLTTLYDQLSKGQNVAAYFAGLEEAKYSDEEVYNQASRALNADKFGELWRGNWQGMYASQSEADFALVDIIAFYTQNRAQIARMFRMSALGQREKAQREDYVSYMLNKCFDRILPPVDIEGFKDRLNEAIEAQRRASIENPPPNVEVKDMPKVEKFPAPPGLVGEVAKFIYAQAPYPVPEIAIAGALGLIAGVVGRAFNISNTGLNQYVLLLAPTGVGKEAMARGIDKLVSAVHKKGVVTANEFIGPGAIASSPALLKYMANGPKSFVSIVGEFGLFMQQLGAQHAPPHLVELRKLILDLYNKSGVGSMVRPAIYSDREKNTPEFSAPSFTILGESTPEKFYEGLHEGLLSEGLLPRFTMIEYYGKKPKFNKGHAYVVPPEKLVEDLASLFAIAQGLNNQHMVQVVSYTPDADARQNAYREHCEMNENSAERDIIRQIWTRCPMKAVKMAAIVAVGINPYSPIIDEPLMNWAIEIVTHDAKNLLKRFDAGEIGVDNEETKQLAAVIKAVHDYVVSPWSSLTKYCGDGAEKLHSDRIVPYSFLHRKLSNIAVFRKDRRGATQALKQALRTLTERGDLAEVSRAVMSKEYSSSSVAYGVERPTAFGF